MSKLESNSHRQVTKAKIDGVRDQWRLLNLGFIEGIRVR